MSDSFIGKRALVTGGSRGIGKIIVKDLIDAGAELFVIAKTRANLDKLKSEIPSVNIISVDFVDWDATRSAVEKIGDIDLLVNNASASHEKIADYSFSESTKELLDLCIEVNLKAAFNISQIAARNMIQRGSGGAIVNVSSIAAVKPLRYMSTYCISKAGLDMMTKVMALELGPYNIRVNTVSPTKVRNEFENVEDNPAVNKVVEEMLTRHPMGKMPDMNDVSNAVLFLLGDKASMITGTILPVDCGYLVS